MALAGMTTNRDFLVATLRTPEFIAGDTTTDFIARVDPPRTANLSETAVTEAACVATLLAQAHNRAAAGALAFISSGFRNSSMPPERRMFSHGEQQMTVHYRPASAGGFEMWVDDGEPVVARLVGSGPIEGGAGEGGAIDVEIDGRRAPYRMTHSGDQWTAHGPGGVVVLDDVARFPDHGTGDVAGGQTAPMPGKVLVVHVAEGDQVVAGQPLVIMEAMKMEHTISAPVDAVVSELRCAEGDQVDNGQVLVVLADPNAEVEASE